jgi:hypothetical protein
MTLRPALIYLLLAVGTLCASGTKKTGATFPARYEGGTLPLSQHRIKATVGEGEVVCVHGNQRFAIPLKSIQQISYSTDVRRRFGSSVLGVVPRMHLDKTETHYVGVTWTVGDGSGGRASQLQAVFKLSGSEHRDFLLTLERLTGRKAVNTDKVPTIVQYEL